MVKHLYLRIEPNAFGGTTHTTLCRRVRNLEDYNLTTEKDEVTCKFCKKEMERRGE